ncbi:transposable element Tc3 transposase [Trichonephila clavipes]|nr:transposable element Tc3 transposase [Trichonephila clavipes]
MPVCCPSYVDTVRYRCLNVALVITFSIPLTHVRHLFTRTKTTFRPLWPRLHANPQIAGELRIQKLDQKTLEVFHEQLKSHRVAASARKGESVRRHLDALTRGRIIGKLEEGRSVTSVAAEFGIAHSIVSRLWRRQFKTTGKPIRGFSSGRPRGTTPADDRCIVLQARRNRWQTAGEIARHTTQATGRAISRFTVARRLHGGGLFARRPVRCVILTPAHRRRRSLW